MSALKENLVRRYDLDSLRILATLLLIPYCLKTAFDTLPSSTTDIVRLGSNNLPNLAYKAGKTTNVNPVEVNNPPNTTIESGCKISFQGHSQLLEVLILKQR